MQLIQTGMAPPRQGRSRAATKLKRKRLAAKHGGTGAVVAVRKRVPSPRALPATVPGVVTPWVRIPQPNGEFVLRPGKPVIEEDEIGTGEAGKMLSLSQRRVNAMCDEGIFVEGRDWWRTPGVRRGGRYHLSRAAVLRVKFGS